MNGFGCMTKLQFKIIAILEIIKLIQWNLDLANLYMTKSLV